MRGIGKLLLCLLAGMIACALPLQVQAREICPEVQVNVEEIGKKQASFGIGEPHRWILRCTLPETEDLRWYTVVQTLPPSLSFAPDSVIVQFLLGTGETMLLQMERDYTLACGSVFVEQGTSDRFSLSLTETGNARVKSGGELRIFYEASLNETAPIGIQILSTAQLNDVSESGHREVYLSDRAAVYTGGIHILLTDMENRPLAGGKFMLARPASQQELAEPTVDKEHLDIDGDPVAVVYETFYDQKGEIVSVAETNIKGETACSGLPFGTYYLVRIDIPASPVMVVIDESSHLTRADGWTDSQGREVDNTIHIESALILLPQTGGPGTLGYTVSGTALIICACMLMWYNRERRVCTRQPE